MKYIDKSPPMMTGDSKRDIQSIVEYLAYLQETVNFNLTQMAKEKRTGGLTHDDHS